MGCYFCKVKALSRFLDIVLYASLFTACCAMGLCMATERLIIGHSPPFFNSLHLLVFGSTLLIYNTPRIVRIPKAELSGDRPDPIWYYVFFFTGLVMALFALYSQRWQLQVASVFLSVFAFAYFLPVLPFKTRKRLRDFGWLKIIVLAGVWTMATSLLPMLYWQKNISDYPFEILVRLVFIFTLCVIFDIRDIRVDISNNISTLPNKVGLRNSYLLINVTLVLFVLLSIAQYIRYPLPGRLAGALLTAMATRFIVTYLRRYPTERAYFILADGVMVFYSFLLLLV